MLNIQNLALTFSATLTEAAFAEDLFPKNGMINFEQV